MYKQRAIYIKEVKCNFCYNWMVIPKAASASLFVCDACLATLGQGSAVCDERGN
jgi:hypothetical protein